MLCLSWSGYSQKETLSIDQFFEIVLNHHPLSRQAQIREEYGVANLGKAKGSFDPKIFGSINQKYFKSDQYYNMASVGLKVPTWYGISFKGGYDNSSGSQLNPERATPDAGLWYAGLELSLGRGLIIDRRRAEMKKAQIFEQSTQQEKRLLLNNLLLEAGSAYWDWFKAYNKMVVYEKAINNAQERFDNVKNGALIGDRPLMDTLEASVQLETQRYNYLQAELEYLNAQTLLEIYLWQDGFVPLELDSTMVAPSLYSIGVSKPDPSLVLKIDSLRTYHPELLNANYNIEIEKVELKLAIENIKPDFNLKYNAINSAEFGNPIENYSINNYVWGAQFSMPIFLRKERNQLRLSKLKLEHKELDLDFKSQQLSFKITTALNEWETSRNQIDLWQKTTQDYGELLKNETSLFNIGESSLFVVNSRQKSFINAELLLIETVKNNQKAALKAKYVLSILN